MGKPYGQKYFSEKYLRHVDWNNPKWRAVRAFALLLSLGRDPLLPFLRANEVDHLRYKGFGWNIGLELPLIDVVPLNSWTHKVVGKLRDAGYKNQINTVLRLAYLPWILSWIYSFALIGQVMGIWHCVPWPQTIIAVITKESHLLKNWQI